MDPLRKGVDCSISAPEKNMDDHRIQSSITSIDTLLHPFARTNSDLCTHGSNVRHSPDPLQKLPSIYLRSTSVCGITINNSLPTTFLADQLDPRHTNRDSGIVQLNMFVLLPNRSTSVFDRVKSGIFGQTAKFGQRPCLFRISNIGIKNILSKQTVKILMRRLIRSRLIWVYTVCKCVSEFT